MAYLGFLSASAGTGFVAADLGELPYKGHWSGVDRLGRTDQLYGVHHGDGKDGRRYALNE